MRSAPMWVKALAVVGALSLVLGVVVLGVKGVGKLQGSDDRVTAPDGSTTGAPVVESPSSTSKNESEGANQSTGTVETGTVDTGTVATDTVETDTAPLGAESAPASFYDEPATVPPEPGTLIRSEPLEYSVVGGQGFRVIYTSIDAAGTPIAVSGMIFLPDLPAPAGGREVLAWAHGTLGLAQKCAPSVSTTYSSTGWLELALGQGWVVTASDYAGLGMAGPPTYLVGQQEARDVVNSVRMAQVFPDAGAGAQWIVYGASQGGHAALWTAHEAADLAPELPLLGVAAAVPAAELPTIMDAQWNSSVGWVIGAAALVSWQAEHPELDFQKAVSAAGSKQVASLNGQCVAAAAASALALNKLHGPFFTSNPLDDPAWLATVTEQMPAQPPKGLPMFLAQGMDDKVVLARTNILLNQQWCAAGVTIQSLWLQGVNHQDTSVVAGPEVIEWATARFGGAPAPSDCAYPPPAPPGIQDG